MKEGGGENWPSWEVGRFSCLGLLGFAFFSLEDVAFRSTSRPRDPRDLRWGVGPFPRAFKEAQALMDLKESLSPMPSTKQLLLMV